MFKLVGRGVVFLLMGPIDPYVGYEIWTERFTLPFHMFNFGKPKTSGDWVVHIAGAIVAIFLIWWMFRLYVL